MRRFSRLLLISSTLLLVMIALLVSGLRLFLPYANDYRPQIARQIENLSGIPLQIDSINGQWRHFGPVIEVRGVSANWPQGQWQSKKIVAALDIWQSLLKLRWQFRDLTFYQLQLQLSKAPFDQEGESDWFSSSQLSDIMLRQLDYFTLRDSRIRFPSPEGETVTLDVDELTWLNRGPRHRAEGVVVISSGEEQRGQFQVRMDLRDRAKVLDSGTLYMQADNIDMKPWLGRWLRSNTGLTSAHFSLAAWVGIKQGLINRIDTQLKQGTVDWHNQGDTPQKLAVDNLFIRAQRGADRGWRVNVPQLSLRTNGEAWPEGQLNAYWQPQEQRLRLRAASLAIERIMPLLPPLAFLSPDRLNDLKQWQVKGEIDRLALDLSLADPLQSHFAATWHQLDWSAGQDKTLPSLTRFSGQASGSLAQGQAHLRMDKGEIRYPGMFRAPLAIRFAEASMGWRHSEKEGTRLWGKNMNVQARSLWLLGDFNFELPAQGKPYLGILGGIRLDDAREAWRYYPEPLMGTALTRYLSTALQGGRVDNATLLFAGNPQEFPFQHNNGLFQVVVPLKQSLFQFSPEWPALQNLDITLDFLNNGLWMWAPALKLGKVDGRNVEAVIPRYSEGKLLVNAKVAGDADEVRNYFRQTPLKESVASTLDEVEVKGHVNGRLHLSIPLTPEGKSVARGAVRLPGNTLTIKKLGLELQQVQGQFRFNDGALQSGPLSAHWSNLPLTLRFDTVAGDKEYQVNSELQGHWPLTQLPGLPEKVAAGLGGKAQWQSKVEVRLPKQGAMRYQGELSADLRHAASNLPAPLEKRSGNAALWQLKVQGDDQRFNLTAALNQQQQFNSQWSLDKDSVRLVRGIWGKASATLPREPLLRLNLPMIDGMGILGLLAAERADRLKGFRWPVEIALETPSLFLAGQNWQHLSVTSREQGAERLFILKGQEIRGQLRVTEKNLWDLNLDYLYYNPKKSKPDTLDKGKEQVATASTGKNTFSPRQVPEIQLQCQDCWLFGQRLRHIEAQLKSEGEQLKLSKGLVDTGNTRLAFDVNWQQQQGKNSTTANGTLSGNNIGDSMGYFGVGSSLKKSPFRFTFALNWHDLPWQPDVQSLSGNLDSRLGKGEISEMGGGRAGQLLRLLSFDALLRKLRLDFSDTFGQAFYFDTIRSHGTIKQGVIYTDDLLIDGLAANISMRGHVDLVKQHINMQATVAPEISTTVGVATAFAVNPLAGAALFAASRVFSPLWDKVSLIRYQINGSFDQPDVEEVHREAREGKKSLK